MPKSSKCKNIYHFPNQTRPWTFSKMLSGKRICRHFKTKSQAEQFAKKYSEVVAEHGAKSFVFSREDKTLLEDLRKICGAETDLREVARFWKTHYKPGTEIEVLCGIAFDEFTEWLTKSGRAQRTIQTVNTTKRPFLEAFRDVPVAKIGKDEILTWINTLNVSARTKRNHVGNIENFLNWCRIAKSWIIDVPKIDERLLPISRKDPVHIWTFSETEKAIRHIEKHERPYLAHYVLRMFAGLRSAEAEQMRWEWIDFENRKITVPAHVCKTRDAWVILPDFCPDAVWEWLHPLRQQEGPIHKPHARVNRRIMDTCNGKPNVLRHTFATMHVAYYGDESKTILAMRHTSLAMLRANYRGANQTKADAERFFALRPMDSYPPRLICAPTAEIVNGAA